MLHVNAGLSMNAPISSVNGLGRTARMLSRLIAAIKDEMDMKRPLVRLILRVCEGRGGQT